jgi:hypothetical protein
MLTYACAGQQSQKIYICSTLLYNILQKRRKRFLVYLNILTIILNFLGRIVCSVAMGPGGGTVETNVAKKV